MSSMFKKKTGPSIKPKFVPRGRAAAAPSATPAPPPPSTTAATAPTPQPTKQADAPAQRVPSPRAQRQTQPAETPKALETGPAHTVANVANVANGQAPSATAPTTSKAAPQSATPADTQPHPSTRAGDSQAAVGSSESVRAVAAPVSQPAPHDNAVAEIRTLPTPTPTQQPAIPATTAPAEQPATTAARQEPAEPARVTAATTPAPASSTTIRPSGANLLPTPSSQPIASAQDTPDEPTATAQPAVEAAPKPTPARRSRKRPAAQATEGQQGSDEPIDSIEPPAPKPKRPRQRKTQPQSETPDGAAEGATPKPKRQRKRRTEGEEGADAEARRRPSRARSETPPGAEEEMVDIQKLKMSDLTRDLRIGKKFSRHDELRERERKDRVRRSADPKASQTPGPSSAGDAHASPAAPGPSAAGLGAAPAGPQFQIVNGQIVVDQSSLVMDRHARDAIDGPIEEIEENEFTHKVTSNSYRTGSKLRGPNHWSADDTEKFYEYLAMHGTDFSIITSLFPGRQRRHIKMKFNREERYARERVDAVLVGPKTKTMNFEEYKAATGREYDLTEDVQAELDRDNAEREAALKEKEEADARENQERLEAIHGTAGKKAAEKESVAVKK